MDWQTLLRGIGLGFSIAAPVGPIGVLAIKRTLERGRLHGLVTGLGAATADGIYGALGALGLTAITSTLVGLQGALRIGGGLFLLWLAISTLRGAFKPQAQAARAASGGLWTSYATTVALTLANPMTILSFIGMFSGFVAPGGSPLLLVLGVVLGSALWWLVLSTLAGALRERLGAGILRWINVASAVVLAVFGVLALLT